MKTKKIPQRMCIVCRTKGDKSSFIRIVRKGADNIFVDKTGKESGRGCYICSAECLSKLKKSHALNRVFKTNVEESVYDNVQRDAQQN